MTLISYISSHFPFLLLPTFLLSNILFTFLFLSLPIFPSSSMAYFWWLIFFAMTDFCRFVLFSSMAQCWLILGWKIWFLRLWSQIGNWKTNFIWYSITTEYFFLMSYEYSPPILEIKQIIWKQILDHVNSPRISSSICLIHFHSF